MCRLIPNPIDFRFGRDAPHFIWGLGTIPSIDYELNILLHCLGIAGFHMMAKGKTYCVFMAQWP